ncbi:MAG TPA: transglycosylase SLT domain-containing protein [Gemmatimonadales bacterium]|nr:transglycosylase SLT domain-containing protein [Gemmatimonadales bacterium]
MDFLTLAALCGPGVDPVTTAAIVKTESHFEPLAIRDNTLQVSIRPTSRRAAESTLGELIRRGDRLAIGLMQITTPWVSRLHLRASDLLDSCTNVRVGTWILSSNYEACRSPGRAPKATLECALSAYWTGDGRIGGAYVNQLYARAGSPYRVSETAGVTDGLLGSGRDLRLATAALVRASGFDFRRR